VGLRCKKRQFHFFFALFRGKKPLTNSIKKILIEPVAAMVNIQVLNRTLTVFDALTKMELNLLFLIDGPR